MFTGKKAHIEHRELKLNLVPLKQFIQDKKGRVGDSKRLENVKSYEQIAEVALASSLFNQLEHEMKAEPAKELSKWHSIRTRLFVAYELNKHIVNNVDDDALPSTFNSDDYIRAEADNRRHCRSVLTKVEKKIKKDPKLAEYAAYKIEDMPKKVMHASCLSGCFSWFPGASRAFESSLHNIIYNLFAETFTAPALAEKQENKLAIT